MEHLSYGDKLRVVQAAEEKALWRPWRTFQCQKGACKKDGDRLSSRPVKSRCKEGIWYREKNGETLEQIPRKGFFLISLGPKV